MALFPYATVDDYIDSAASGGDDALLIGNLDDPNNPDYNRPLILEALLTAVRRMDGLLAQRYDLCLLHDFDPPLKMLVDFNIDLARFELDSRYEIRENVQKRYDNAIRELKEIAMGKAVIIDNDCNVIDLSETAPSTQRGRIGRGNIKWTQKWLDSFINPYM